MIPGDELPSTETPVWESETAAVSPSIISCYLGNLNFSHKAL